MARGRTVAGAEETVISNLGPGHSTNTKSLVGDDERERLGVVFCASSNLRSGSLTLVIIPYKLIVASSEATVQHQQATHALPLYTTRILLILIYKSQEQISKQNFL